MLLLIKETLLLRTEMNLKSLELWLKLVLLLIYGVLNSYCIRSLGTAKVEWEGPFEVECWGCDHCGVLRLGSWSGGKTSFKARWCEGAGFVTLLLYLRSLTHMSSTYTNLKLAIASSLSSLASKKVGLIIGTQIFKH